MPDVDDTYNTVKKERRLADVTRDLKESEAIMSTMLQFTEYGAYGMWDAGLDANAMLADVCDRARATSMGRNPSYEDLTTKSGNHTVAAQKELCGRFHVPARKETSKLEDICCKMNIRHAESLVVALHTSKRPVSE